MCVVGPCAAGLMDSEPITPPQDEHWPISASTAYPTSLSIRLQPHSWGVTVLNQLPPALRDLRAMMCSHRYRDVSRLKNGLSHYSTISLPSPILLLRSLSLMVAIQQHGESPSSEISLIRSILAPCLQRLCVLKEKYRLVQWPYNRTLTWVTDFVTNSLVGQYIV